MRINPGAQNNNIFIKGSTANSSSSVLSIEKGQILEGRITSKEGRDINILLKGGHNITALLESRTDLPINLPVKFEVVENAGSKIILKPSDLTPQSDLSTVSKERSAADILSRLGLKNTLENLEFLEKSRGIVGRGIENLFNALKSNENTGLLQRLQNLFVTPERLGQYLKGFESENMQNLIVQLETLFKEINKEGLSSNACSSAIADIVKGLSLQINHPFPLFYIPIPLIFEDTLYPGELWVEKHEGEDGKDRELINIHLFIETPTLGSIEGVVKNSGNDTAIDLFCREDLVPLFENTRHMLKERLAACGIAVKSIGIYELRDKSNFLELARKYAKPYPVIDTKA